MIDFLDELGNFKQKNFYTSKCNFFSHFIFLNILGLNDDILWYYIPSHIFDSASFLQEVNSPE